MSGFFLHKKSKILIIFFLVFYTNSYAETLTSSQTNTSTDTIQDYTINTGVTLTILNTSPGLKITGSERTFKNYGTILSTEDDGSSTNITIKAVGPTDGAYDVKIFNYGTIHQENTAAIFVPNNDDQNGDGIGAYVYNEGTIKSDDTWTIRYHGSNYTKFDNYGTITATSTAYAFRGYDDNYTTINNYAGALIYSEGSGAISQKSGSLSNQMKVNNWGKISAEWDTVELGDASILNNYGEIIVQNTSYSTRAAIQMWGDNSTVNLYDGTLLVGTIDAADKSPSGSKLNIDLCSSYYFKVEGTWTVNDISGCGDVVYSGGFAQAVSPLFQSIADEVGVLRTDLINDIYDFAKDAMENNEKFVLPLKSYTKREHGLGSIDKFASSTNGVAFGLPTVGNKVDGHLVFNFMNNNIDLLNHNIKDVTYQAGFFLGDQKIKAILGYHNYEGDRNRLNNTVASGKDTFTHNNSSLSSIIGKQFSRKINNNSYLKSNLDFNFERFSSYRESNNVKWINRVLGQSLAEVTYGWKSLPENKLQFNPELTLGYRTVINGKNQKYTFQGTEKTFSGGRQEDYSGKFSLSADYSFAKDTKLAFDTSAKITNSKQETYSLNISFKSIF